jgi:hypothetical protein
MALTFRTIVFINSIKDNGKSENNFFVTNWIFLQTTPNVFSSIRTAAWKNYFFAHECL